MKDGAPIRFLLLLAGGWTCLRFAVLAFGGAGEDVERSTAAAFSPAAAQAAHRASGAMSALAGRGGDRPAGAALPLPGLGRPQPLSPEAPVAAAPPASAALVDARRAEHGILAPNAALDAGPTRLPGAALPATGLGAVPVIAAAPPRQPERWSGSAWLLAREAGGAALAPGGALGGGQAGARLLYRLNDDPGRPLAVAARLYAPLRGLGGAEAALGLDWRPVATLPIHLLVERRQRLGRDGRSAFAAAVHGGGSAMLARGWRIDAYAQAGVVGVGARDLFADGAARLVRPFGPVETGAAVWAAAQPGASRLDVGPQLAMPIHVGDASLRLSAEYRFRLAGKARPASGPALTLGLDF